MKCWEENQLAVLRSPTEIVISIGDTLIWELGKKRVKYSLIGHREEVTAMYIDLKDHFLASVDTSNCLILWNLSKRPPICKTILKLKYKTFVDFTRNSGFLIVGGG